MDNELTPFACGRLGEALSFNKLVKSLSILHNDIGDDGVEALLKGMAFNQTIEQLHLEYCEIEADGCEAIGMHSYEQARKRRDALRSGSTTFAGILE